MGRSFFKIITHVQTSPYRVGSWTQFFNFYVQESVIYEPKNFPRILQLTCIVCTCCFHPSIHHHDIADRHLLGISHISKNTPGQRKAPSNRFKKYTIPNVPDFIRYTHQTLIDSTLKICSMQTGRREPPVPKMFSPKREIVNFRDIVVIFHSFQSC